MRCAFCGEELKLDREKGWVHQDGSIYKQRLMTPEEVESFYRRHKRWPSGREEMVDDHCVRPVQELVPVGGIRRGVPDPRPPAFQG